MIQYVQFAALLFVVDYSSSNMFIVVSSPTLMCAHRTDRLDSKAYEHHTAKSGTMFTRGLLVYRLLAYTIRLK